MTSSRADIGSLFGRRRSGVCVVMAAVVAASLCVASTGTGAEPAVQPLSKAISVDRRKCLDGDSLARAVAALIQKEDVEATVSFEVVEQDDTATVLVRRQGTEE